MTVPIMRANFADLMQVKAYWNTIVNNDDAYPRPEDFAAKFYNRIDTTKKDEKFTEVAGLDRMVQANEYGDLNYDAMMQLADKTLEPVPYNLATIISREAADNDQSGLLKQYAGMFRNSYFETIQILAHDILNGGFATTTVADGQYLFSTAHPTYESTNKNKLSTDSDLSVSSLQQALIDGTGITDYRGKKLNIKYDTLIVPTALKFTVDEILKSPSKPYTANNEINPLKGEGIKVIVSPYLTDPDAWFMLDSSIKGKKHPLQAVYGAAFETEMEKDFDKSNAFKVRAYFRAIFASVFWMGIMGTPGAT